ncbi:MAG: YqgE/AlgH family protein [Pirellulaceae bacterium]|nr:YqgE/AlgH family protein [Pirellulaceae bacterium]
MKRIEGKLLIASPHLHDPSFCRAVILVLKHDPNEAFGLILNRPTDHRLSDVIAMVSKVDCVHDGPLFCGGPVEGPLMALHDIPDSVEVDGRAGVAVSVHQESILKLVSQDDIRLRLFDGYSGWGPMQLEDEIEHGSWLITDANSENVFREPDELWQQLVAEIGRDIVTTGINPFHLPSDPGIN